MDKITVGLSTVLGIIIALGNLVVAGIGALAGADPFGVDPATWTKAAAIAGAIVLVGRQLQGALAQLRK